MGALLAPLGASIKGSGSGHRRCPVEGSFFDLCGGVSEGRFCIFKYLFLFIRKTRPSVSLTGGGFAGCAARRKVTKKVVKGDQKGGAIHIGDHFF